MPLKGKFILAVVTVLSLSYGVLMVYTSRLQNRLVIGQAEQQARMLFKQILYTRQWVADHQGLFLIQTDTARPNPFLHEAVVTTDSGLTLVKRNPAMVTRELAEYAARAGFSWFRVTSLKPINPKNVPDPFEEESLRLFAEGKTEQLTLTDTADGRVLRFAAPLTVEKACLACHQEHGYEVGDIRGALSIAVPIAWAESTISGNNRTILLYGLLSVLAVVMVMYSLFDRLVTRPIRQLSQAMAAFPETGVAGLRLPAGKDEFGSLAAGFTELCRRLETSRDALNSASEKGFRMEKLAALGQLTAGIAHEINNPLAGMLNCLKSMQREPDNLDLQRRYLSLLDKGLRRIELTMRQLLNYGRVEPLRLRRIDIDAVILDCLELLGFRLRNITVNLDLRLNGNYCIDSEAVKQIVMNIALNAIQAMPDGGVLNLSSREAPRRIVLTVEDTGTGIAPEIQDRIFDPFFTTKEVGEGTGLGLAVTLAMVQRLDGNIEVRSRPGEGSTFLITLPIDLVCPSEGPDSPNGGEEAHAADTAG